MRFSVLFTLAFGVVALTASTALTACESTTSPTLAALGGAASTSGSTTTPLVISPGQVQLSVGRSTQLSTNASAALQSQLQWSSDQASVASVSSTGLVTAFAAGTATISVRYATDTANAASATVVVSAP